MKPFFGKKDDVKWYWKFFMLGMLQNVTVEGLLYTVIVRMSEQRLRSVVLFWVCYGLYDYSQPDGNS